MGNVLKDQGKLDEAIEAYKKTISLKPDYADAHQSLSISLLNCGRLKEGFDEYEWRWKNKKFYHSSDILHNLCGMEYKVLMAKEFFFGVSKALEIR